MSKQDLAINKLKFQLLAYGGFALSTVLSCKLCWALQATILSVVFGVILELAKLSFGRKAGSSYREGMPVKALFQVMLCVGLIAVSLSASIGWFASAEVDHRVGTPEFQAISAAVSAKEIEIQSMANVAKTRSSLKATKALGILNQQADDLRLRLAILETSDAPLLGSIDGSLAGILDVESSTIRVGLYGLLALLLEIITLMAFWELDGRTVPVPSRVQRTATDTDGRPDTGTGDGTDTRYKQVFELVKGGKCKPTVRGIRKACEAIGQGCGQKIAERYKERLLGDLAAKKATNGESGFGVAV